MNLKLSMWSAILLAVISIPNFVLAFLVGGEIGPEYLQNLSLGISIVVLIATILVGLGFITIANKKGLESIRNLAFFMILISIVVNVYDWIVADPNVFVSGVAVFVSGMVLVVFGVFLISNKKKINPIAKPLGVLYIISGVFYASFILMIFAPFVGVASSILEAVLFYRLSKK